MRLRILSKLSFGIVALASGLACQPAQETSQTKIFGGVPSTTGSWPNAVAITNTQEGNVQWCTGTAVSPTLIITAAHCLDMVNPEERKVYVGEGFDEGVGENPGSLGGQYEVARFKVHPRYGSVGGYDQAFDVGYMVLKDPLPLPSEAYPEILQNPAEIQALLNPSRKSRIVGFGRREGGESGSKWETDVPITDVGRTEIKMGGGGFDACNGDSGGPAYALASDGRYKVFGIVSRGDAACRNGGIWGLMHAHLCWFHKETGDPSVQPRFDDCLETEYTLACEKGVNATSVEQATLTTIQKVLPAGLSCREQTKYLMSRKSLYLATSETFDLSLLNGLKALERLSVQNAKSLVVSTGSVTLPKLRELNLSGSQLAEAGDSFVMNLPELSYLNLSRTGLTEAQLDNFGTTLPHDVDLSFNLLKKIERLRPLLGNTRKLFLNNNLLDSVSALDQATSLETLSLGFNRIQDLSPLTQLPALKQLYLNGNPLDQSLSFCSQDVQAPALQSLCASR